MEQIPYNVIGITGNPATGKKTIGKIIAKRLSYDFLNLNQLALDKGAIRGHDDYGYIVDLKSMKKYSREEIMGKKIIIAGHLLPSISQKKKLIS